MNRSRRRGFLGLLVGGATPLVAGCFGETRNSRGTNEPPEKTDVIAGPDDTLVFEPDELSISTGESVTWYFASPGHNVSCRPEDSKTVALPDDADPFASYSPEESMRQTIPPGDTYTQTFEVPGEYVYVCIPHVTSGMVGTITVTD